MTSLSRKPWKDSRYLRIRFTSELNLGHVLTVVSMVGTLLAVWRNMEMRLTVLETCNAVQQQTIERISTALQGITENQTRLTALFEEHKETISRHKSR
jgi:uncharacterized coiled-coil protein SlyX